MKALIAPNQPVCDGHRVAEVSETDFPVAPPFFWVDCGDNVVADSFWYNPDTGEIVEYIPPPLSEEVMAQIMRDKRNSLLVELDAIVSNPLRWNSFSQDQHTAYATYRQDLLDVPQQPGFPTTINWPTKP